MIKFLSVFFLPALILLVSMTSAKAEVQYSEQKIEKHLQQIFKKNLVYEKRYKGWRYLPFGKVIIFYMDFSDSIQNQQQKRNTIERALKKYADIMHCTFKVKYGIPPISFYRKDGFLVNEYHRLDPALNSFVYMKFVKRDELFQNLENGFWHDLYGNVSDKTLKKYVETIKSDKDIVASKFSPNSKRLLLHSYKLIELNKHRKKHFYDYIEKELYLTFLEDRERTDTSSYIVPSTFNNRYDDFSKPEISKFDWVLFDEFYNNKSLKKLMYYKDVIPILAKEIAKKMGS
ncbi:hypothetical protein [Hydrogenovibrio kuenenii]|uniref:hypothetical protein n=1 Tax=Hydrogenovibrio kuenenii TaxID=63658 RepID=UPI000467DCE7|nr:hypothetical protein [Hydrogenovibrio kuenenii]